VGDSRQGRYESIYVEGEHDEDSLLGYPKCAQQHLFSDRAGSQ
jgi:hypothetical protein